MPDVAVSTLPHNWALAAFLLGVLGLCAFMLLVSSILGSRAWGRSKNEPFESGIVSTGDTRLRFSAKFYLVAMLFVIFDVEARSEEHTSELQSRENIVCRLFIVISIPSYITDFPYPSLFRSLCVLGLCDLMLLVTSLLGSRAWGRSKNEPFESGIVSTGDTRLRFSAKFYLVAMLFVIFDVEA